MWSPPNPLQQIVSRHIWRLTFVVTNSTTSQAPPRYNSSGLSLLFMTPLSKYTKLFETSISCYLNPPLSNFSFSARAWFSNTNNISPKGVTWHFGKPNIIHRHGKKGVKTGKKFPQIRHFPSTPLYVQDPNPRSTDFACKKIVYKRKLIAHSTNSCEWCSEQLLLVTKERIDWNRNVVVPYRKQDLCISLRNPSVRTNLGNQMMIWWELEKINLRFLFLVLRVIKDNSLMMANVQP